MHRALTSPCVFEPCRRRCSENRHVPARSSPNPRPTTKWSDGWRAQLVSQAADPQSVAEAMDKVNPVYIPRNHKVEETLDAARAGDLRPSHRLLEVLTRPFDEQPGLESFAAPAPPSLITYRTFCGT